MSLGQGVVRATEMIVGQTQVKLISVGLLFLGEAECLSGASGINVTDSSIDPFDVGRVDLVTRLGVGKDLIDFLRVTEDNPSSD